MKKRKFFNFVMQNGGLSEFGRKIGQSPQSVYAWLYTNVAPRPIVMQQIVKMSRGKLTYDDIINETAGVKGTIPKVVRPNTIVIM